MGGSIMFEELYALAVLYANGFDTGEQFHA